jgi:hypothetical protein
MFSKSSVFIFIAVLIIQISCQQNQVRLPQYDQALKNGKLAQEGFIRCNAFMYDWLTYCDPESGLFPENLDRGKDTWNAHNSAADNYPFMVLTSSFTDPSLFSGKMMDILGAETKLTSRLDRIPDAYSFSKQDFKHEEIDLDRLIFGGSEYIKDGILPLTEWLGKSPWSDRMIGILDDIWKYAPVKTKFGNIPSTNVEINGEQLQILARIYWFTGDQKYLDWAIRLGDYYLLDNQHPTEDFEVLRLRDHGCEIVSGLCELYASVNFSDKSKKEAYQAPLHKMLDDILLKGRNEHGLFYNSINPKTGEPVDNRIADNWGYTYNGFYAVYLIDSIQRYKEALLNAFRYLHHYENYDWENGSADGFADAIEGALNLYNRERIQTAGDWIDKEMQIMWSLQDSSYRENAQKWKNRGIIEGWHGDGNFARTAIMYCLWKTQGTSISPWSEDIIYGATQEDGVLFFSMQAKEPWEGKLIFDTQRHKTSLQLPLDWPRINQFPEWYVIDPEKQYEIYDVMKKSKKTLTGSELLKGFTISLGPDDECHLRIKPK